MTATPTPSAKALALAALDRALEEAKRDDPSPLVLAALVGDARVKVGAIQELVRPRRVKKDKGPA